MAQVKILNMMHRGYSLHIMKNGVIKEIPIPSRESVVVDKESFDMARKGSRALQAMLDQKLLVTATASGTISTPDVDDLVLRTSKPERPAELQDTANSELTEKVRHEVKKTEMVEIEVPSDAPKGGKRRGRKSKAKA